MTLRFTRVTFRDDAMDDLRRLAERSRVILVEVFRLLKALDAGALVAVPLHDHVRTGDLVDCGKTVVAVDGEPEHRIVVRDLGEDAFEVGAVSDAFENVVERRVLVAREPRFSDHLPLPLADRIDDLRVLECRAVGQDPTGWLRRRTEVG